MKRNVLFMMFGAAILLTMNACKSELDLDKELKFSKLTVEEQKASIEQNGLDFVTAMEGMQDTKAMKAMMNMLELSGAEMVGAPMQKFVADVKNGRKNAVSNFDRQMRVSYIDSEVWGEYNYNAETQEMDLVKTLSNKIIARFPATSGSTANNAVITITYEESTVAIPDMEGEKFPSKITFEMTVDSKEVMTADFSGKYYDDGSPKEVNQKLEMGDYKWSAEIDNNKKTFSESYEFKKGSKTIIKTLAEVKGTLTESELTAAMENETPENAIKEFAVFFQVMDVAVKGGTTDFKGMVAEFKALSEKLSEKEMLQKQADILNKYMVCTAYFVDDNRKFADVEMYVVEDTYTNYNYDWNGNIIGSTTYTDYYLGTRFVLSDGSKVAAEEYVQEGFDKIVNKIEDLENDF